MIDLTLVLKMVWTPRHSDSGVRLIGDNQLCQVFNGLTTWGL